MSITLHVGNKRYSSWSLRGYLALVQTGARFETRTIWLDRPSTRAEIAKVSPAGRVPVLEVDGLFIWDTLAICEYLNEVYPDANLWPQDRAARARARSISAEMHAGFEALRRDMPQDLGPSLRATLSPEAVADVQRVQDIWREQLAASGGPFLFGSFTIADVMYAPVAGRFTTYGVEVDPVCRGYMDAIAALPAFVAWVAEAKTEPPK